MSAASIPVALLLPLLHEWAEAAGQPGPWLALHDAQAAMYAEPDAGKRAHWRCATQLVHLCEQATGQTMGELLEKSMPPKVVPVVPRQPD